MTFNPRDIFTKNRSDLSNFLIHLNKDGSYENWEEARLYPGHFVFGASETFRAEQSLIDILRGKQPTLLARAPFSIFKFLGINTGKTKKLDIPPKWLKCVCFSETPLRELKSFYAATQDSKNFVGKTNRYQKYGIAFAADFVRGKNGHPVFYYDRRNTKVSEAIEKLGDSSLHSITKSILPYCEPYGPKVVNPQEEIDFRWEREWRIIGDFNFDLDNVAFGLCPESKIDNFERLVDGKFPFIDPDWDIEFLKNHLEKKNLKQLAERL